SEAGVRPTAAPPRQQVSGQVDLRIDRRVVLGRAGRAVSRTKDGCVELVAAGVDLARARAREAQVRRRKGVPGQARALMVRLAVGADVPGRAHAAVPVRNAVKVAVRARRARDAYLADRAQVSRGVARAGPRARGGGN